jgi:UDP-GlcNAc:undecaprenyl-phosphate/decaprenyl-phosphate GlcNAc-1-phosphate transferase
VTPLTENSASLSTLAAAPSLLTAMAITFAACWPLERLAIRLGILDRPDQRKLHRRPVAYLGGVAIWLGTVSGVTLFHLEFGRRLALLTVVLALGIADDVFCVGVSSKLVVQAGAALAAVGLGSAWHITDSSVLNTVVSVVWIVGLTNSFNLLDNMDGLASTVSATGLLVLAVVNPGEASFTLALAGGAIGFLFHNSPPARMFMGDAGSLVIGFGVATATIAAANRAHGLHSVVMLAGPVAVAVFDTALVVVSRLIHKRPIQLGGRDHFSHRLQLLGWSPFQIMGASAGAAVLAGLAAYLAGTYPFSTAWLAVPLLAAGAIVWWRLLHVDPYGLEKPVLVEAHSA